MWQSDRGRGERQRRTAAHSRSSRRWATLPSLYHTTQHHTHQPMYFSSWTTPALIALGGLVLLAWLVSTLFRERVPSWSPRGSRVLITGGSSGIGLATAERLAREGAACIALLARDQAKLDEAVTRIQAANSATRVVAISADVSKQATVQAACDKAIKAMGGETNEHVDETVGLQASQAHTAVLTLLTAVLAPCFSQVSTA